MDKYSKIIGQYIESINLFNELEKQPRTYGTNVELFNSEIDTLMIIGDNPTINLTQLSKELGISKSGTSRFIRNLLSKELIVKARKKGNAKEVVFTLTPEGNKAYKGREKFNRETFSLLYQNIQRYVDDDLHRISEFLESTNDEVRRLL